MIKPDWIAVDWGTTNLRVWAMGAAGQVMAKRSSDKGMQRLERAAFEPALLELIEDWLSTESPMHIICCGMVGARQGWIEAEYRSTPAKVLDPRPMTKAPSTDPRLRVHILPGVKQLEPADVMRGEETQIAGFLSQNQGFSGMLCLPGTHSKWVHIKQGEISKFTTFMTGELFSLLSEHSVLRHSLSGEGWDSSAFKTALTKAVHTPANLAADLFSVRARSLVGPPSPASARASLSGLLIGQEVGAMRAAWQGQDLAILGAGSLAKLYATALDHMGVDVKCHEIDPLTLAGCTIAFNQLDRTK